MFMPSVPDTHLVRKLTVIFKIKASGIVQKHLAQRNPVLNSFVTSSPNSNADLDLILSRYPYPDTHTGEW